MGPLLNLLHMGNDSSSVELEAALIQYTSRIARQIPSIEAFYVDNLEGESWTLSGWLNVRVESCSVDGRHTVGPLWHYDAWCKGAEYPKYCSKTFRV
ncbi:hypothetical protein BT96DRAFT_230269 [Gymnopus androsaceus JB14]|uniref:Uncharacterized protein n=1 Tax=Gymnopus androsaceus JB14 TaxID=1447944 RepID=A0A6A4H611_9AGAR|nr:hypothetical protein BT96DRAFT_230269 [Gymnopus androsaceus JB14]